MEDTVGSNVITTSMAMGLAIIVSDVGSIRDYCNKENAVFCMNDINEFVEAIKKLCHENHRVRIMKEQSKKISSHWSIQNINKWFSSLKI